MTENEKKLRYALTEKHRKLKDQLALMRYQRHPDIWLEERLQEPKSNILWSKFNAYKNHEWDGDMDPLYQAWVEITKPGRKWAAIESASGTSKTFTLARIIFWFLDVWPDSRVVISAPKQEQLTKNVWSEVEMAFEKFKRIRPFAELQATQLFVTKGNKSHRAELFVAGVRASEANQSATKAQGIHRENLLIITEETPGIHPAVMRAFTMTSRGSNNRILAVGNPDSIVDPLHLFATTRPNVRQIRISGHDHPNIVLNKEVFPGCISVTQLEDDKAIMGEDSTFYLSRNRGICPSQGTDSLFKLKDINRCVPHTNVWIKQGEINPDNGPGACGVDVAASENGDAGAICWGSGNRCVKIETFQCPDPNAVAWNLLYDDYIVEEANRPVYPISKLDAMGVHCEYVGVDPVGVGAGTVNEFKANGWDIQSLQGGENKNYIPVNQQNMEPLYHFSSWRAQAYWELNEDLRNGNIILDLDIQMVQALITQLIVMEYSTAGGKIVIEPKEKIKKKLGGKSPNEADALNLWNWARKGRLDKGPDLPFVMGGTVIKVKKRKV